MRRFLLDRAPGKRRFGKRPIGLRRSWIGENAFETLTGLVSAQAEYQARILPALAAQLMTETTRCGHPRTPVPVRSAP